MANRVLMQEEPAEETIYKKDRQKRLSVGRQKKIMLQILLVMVIVYVVCILVPNPLSYITNPNMQDNWISAYWSTLRGNIAGLGRIMETRHLATDLMGMFKNQTFVWAYEFITLLAGAAFSVSGAVFQGSFRNTIASPSTLGVISGGKMGAVLCMLLFYTDDMIYIGIGEGKLVDILMVCAGCFGAVIFTVCVSIAAGRGKMSMINLIVTGTILSGSINTLIELIQYDYVSTHPFDAKTEALRVALAAGVDLRQGCISLAYLIPTIVLIIIICLMGKRLNLLALGEDEATMLGINVKRTRYLMVILCTLLTTSILATFGAVGFIGLIIPNIARRLVGSDFRRLLPASAMVGGIFLMLVDKMPFFPWLNGADVLNPMATMIGGAFFIFLLIRNRRKRNADWAR